MSTKKSKKLTLVKQAPTITGPVTIQPKPNKSEIISALVQRAAVKHAEEQTALEKKRNELRKQIDDAVTAELDAKPQNFTRRVCLGYNHVEVESAMKVIPPHIKRLIQARDALPKIRTFDEKETRRQITNQMGASKDARVKAMLSDPETVKKLDETLDAIAA